MTGDFISGNNKLCSFDAVRASRLAYHLYSNQSEHKQSVKNGRGRMKSKILKIYVVPTGTELTVTTESIPNFCSLHFPLSFHLFSVKQWGIRVFTLLLLEA